MSLYKPLVRMTGYYQPTFNSILFIKQCDRSFIFHQATDADIGVNAAFFFSVLSGNADRKFSVDSFSGELSSVTPLDREDHDSYILIVRVSDLYGNHSYGLVFDDTAVVEVIVEVTNKKFVSLM